MPAVVKWLLAAAVAALGQSVAQMPRERILEEVISSPKLAEAPAADGRAVFEKVCATCHKFGSLGKTIGPDLSTLAAKQSRKDVLESLLWPSRAIADQYRTVLVEKRDGDIVAGMVQREDAVRLVLVAANALDAPVTVLKSQIKVRQASATSLMPEDLLNEFTLPQVASLVTFLFSAPPR
jgi:putative heme-binding domain-containing protein